MPRYKDETGNKYGKLTVLYPTDKRNSKREIFWHCKCDCGNECDVLGRLLRNGNTRSCGCLRVGSKTLDEIGNRYGKLTVISQAKDKINNHVAWNCLCDCGNNVIVSGTKLRSQEITACPTCRQLQKSKLTDVNEQYGDLTVLESAGRDKYRRLLWKCQCSCGNICVVTGVDLRSGQKTNCGCKKTLSKGADKIRQILQENNIQFVQEKTFDSCRFPDTNQLARFDFYLPEQNILIEYDGNQHFFYTNHHWDTKEHFEYTKRHDEYKNQWCKENNMKLIRIPYYDIKQISYEKISALF